ncbi:MAG: type II toxin-antitoxin system RelE/ParE family toxin [Burkholderiaceae bacterium]|nr:type II toxin-antitoxin system RelE/ParE family toxin [Burkholderiaceae bacterium]
MSVLKRKSFAKWQANERLDDAVLCEAVLEMEAGLIDAELGGLLFKKRIARPGQGKRSGYRTLLSARIGSRYVFMCGFAKSDRANITLAEQKALQFGGEVFLGLTGKALQRAIESGVLLEVCCEQNH